MTKGPTESRVAPVELASTRPDAVSFPVMWRENAPIAPSQMSKATSAAVSPGSPFAEEFRILAAKARSMGEVKPLKVVGIVSAGGGEGKTTVALGLATAMSREQDRRVLLIEADLRKPSIDNYLGLERRDGLSEWLETTPPQAPVSRVSSLGFFLLSAGRPSSQAADWLGSDRMARLLESARRSFDFVVVDCPPLAPVADSVMLQDLLDGFFLVVRTRHTPLETILRSVSNVKPERIQGIVVNGHRELLRSYYNYGYGGYRYYGQPEVHLAPSAVAASSPPVRRPEPEADPEARPPAKQEAPAPSADEPPTRAESIATRSGVPAIEAAPGPTLPKQEPRRRAPVLAALAVIVAVAAWYFGIGPGAQQPASPPPTTLSSRVTAAEARVSELEERLKRLEQEKQEAEAKAAADAQKRVQGQAAARGQVVDPAVLLRAQEEARRKAQADQERLQQEVRARLEEERRVETARLEEERRRAEALAAAAATPPPTLAPVTQPVVTAPPATAPPTTAAAEPALRPGTLVSLGSPGVIAPVLVWQAPLQYPSAALQQRAEGIVELNVLIDEGGKVTEAKVVTGAIGIGLNQAAIDNVKTRKYRPATKEGVPVKVHMIVRVRFQLAR